MDFKKLLSDRREELRNSPDADKRRRATILDRMDETQAEVEAMDDVLFLQKLLYYSENSCSPEFMHHYPVGRRGENMTYDTVLHHIMYPELLKRLPRLIPKHNTRHHFLCKEGQSCNHRCDLGKGLEAYRG